MQAVTLERDELKVENEQQYRMHNERIMNSRKENIATSNSLQEEHARKCDPYSGPCGVVRWCLYACVCATPCPRETRCGLLQGPSAAEGVRRRTREGACSVHATKPCPAALRASYARTRSTVVLSYFVKYCKSKAYAMQVHK